MIKRVIDVIVADLALIILSPVLLLMIFLIRRKLDFRMVKFRTMLEAVDAQGNSLPKVKTTSTALRIFQSSSTDFEKVQWHS